MAVNNDYMIELADKVKNDIHKCQVNSKEVALDSVYRRDRVVYAETERVYIGEDINLVQLFKEDGRTILSRYLTLKVKGDEKIKLTIPIEIEDITKEGDDE